MKRALLSTILLVSVALPANAQRQLERDTGSMIPVPRRARISDSGKLSDQARARVTLAQFARCTVDRRSKEVAALAGQSADKLGGMAMAKVADDECLSSGEMRMKPMLMRGALFVELYRRRERAAGRGEPWSMPAVAFDGRTPVDTGDGDLALQFGLLSFAECVVRHDAQATRAVVLAPTASNEQDAAFAALAPHLGQCLPGGQKIALGKSILEGALGEVLYRGTVPVAPSVSQEAR
ncbi:hypothetical protein [Sphingomonas hankookensis]|uniref:Uncharacterized protein n=1 Tax=Sphingomonas hengshuiensis TaxID=1609977 RepID=A0A2W4ZL40_9SPHN|nr:MAG: hypothetical protein DI632_01680 [Sphingomonas hengshuiensis]